MKTSSRHVLTTSLTRLQRNNFSSSKTARRRLKDVLQIRLEDVLEEKNCYAEDIFKTSWRHVFKTSWWHVFKTSWRQTKCVLEIYVSSKSKCVSKKPIFHKSISDESKVNPKCINQNTIISIFVLFGNTSSISILRIKISEIGDSPSEAMKTKF